MGIERFNRTCRDSVFTYKADWEALSERIAYWLDYERPYVTCDTSYIESVWWILSRLARKGLLYRGHKSVPYCPRCGTALSSHEVALGYREVEDPSLFFLAPLLAGDGEPDPRGTRLPGLDHHPVDRALQRGAGAQSLPHLRRSGDGWPARDPGEGPGRARARRRRPDRARARCPLAGRGPLRPAARGGAVPDGSGAAWRIILEDFVTAEDGTGIVHIAPAFGRTTTRPASATACP